MKQIRDKVAGLDVHRDNVVAASRIVEPDRTVQVEKESFATTSRGLSELVVWLLASGATTIAMEATGVYWKPVYYALEGPVRGAVAVQRRPRQERPRAKERPGRRRMAG
jgi:hypothetical protein